MNRTIDIMQTAQVRTQLAAHPPDLLIEVPRTTCRSLDFHRTTEVIDVGRQSAARALDANTQTTR
jgi:NTE family protein